MAELETTDAHDLTAAFASGELSPVEVTKAVLSQIDQINGRLNAFTEVGYEAALADAKASETRWQRGAPLSPWDGVPATVKDLIATKTWQPAFGSHVIQSELVGEDGPAVARLREAGCVLLGMTTSPELGWKGVNDSPRFGNTRNAWNSDKTPGGSSGGAAVAAALNLGWFHIGTDGGGSIRMPAAFSGVFGLKPTFGRVPAYPASIMGTLAHVGPITRSVRDATAMLNLVSRQDPRDWYAGPELSEIRLPPLGDLRGFKIAFSPNLGHLKVDAEVAAAVKRAAETLTDLGVTVVESPFSTIGAQKTFETLWFGAARHRLAKLSDAERARVDPDLIAAAESAAHLSVADHLDANLHRAELGRKAEALLNQYDALITPTVPVPAFDVGRETPSGRGRWTDWAAFNYPFNLTQQPACSVPCGFTAAGLPIGLQVISRKYRDDCVLKIAAAYQAASPVPWPRTKQVIEPAQDPILEPA